MCLGIPGEILESHAGPGGLRYGTVRFGGAARRVCLAYTPEAVVGDWVVVHAGFAIAVLDEAEAAATLRALAAIGDFVIVHVGLALSRISPEDAEETFRYLEEMQELADLGDEMQALERSEVP